MKSTSIRILDPYLQNSEMSQLWYLEHFSVIVKFTAKNIFPECLYRTLSRSTAWGSLMHIVLTPLSCRSFEERDLFSSKSVVKWSFCQIKIWTIQNQHMIYCETWTKWKKDSMQNRRCGRLTVASYARLFNMSDNSTWHRTEGMILARELILCMSVFNSDKISSESSGDTKSTLLRITTSYEEQCNDSNSIRNQINGNVVGMFENKKKLGMWKEKEITLPHMLFEEMLRKKKKSHCAYWAGTWGFWHLQPSFIYLKCENRNKNQKTFRGIKCISSH